MLQVLPEESKEHSQRSDGDTLTQEKKKKVGRFATMFKSYITSPFGKKNQS
jgi:hypothetical protein